MDVHIVSLKRLKKTALLESILSFFISILSDGCLFIVEQYVNKGPEQIRGTALKSKEGELCCREIQKAAIMATPNILVKDTSLCVEVIQTIRMTNRHRGALRKVGGLKKWGLKL